MKALQSRVLANTPDEASIKIRERHGEVGQVTIREANEIRGKKWYEYTVLWSD